MFIQHLFNFICLGLPSLNPLRQKNMIKRIMHASHIYAIIIGSDFKKEGIDFFTPDDFAQQLGYMNRPKGYHIPAHKHRVLTRTLSQTQEVLVVKSGKVKVSFFDEEGVFFEAAIISKGDVILLAYGGHGFEMLEDSEMIEIKQGPYLYEDDKVLLKTVVK